MPEDVTGWKLLESLFMVGMKNPSELARLLEEQDPLKVREGAGQGVRSVCFSEDWSMHNVSGVGPDCCCKDSV